MEIGVRIKELREKEKKSQRIVANAIGYSQTIVGAWERGEKQPTADAIKKLAIFFDVSADYLLGLSDTP